MKYLVSKRKQGGKKKYEQFFATEEGNAGCLDHSGLSDLRSWSECIYYPMNLYSGGAVGLAQLLSYGAGQIGIKEIAGLNLYGIIYLLLNIPILFIAWFKIGKTFFINTILGTVGISLFTSIVPIRQQQ